MNGDGIYKVKQIKKKRIAAVVVISVVVLIVGVAAFFFLSSENKNILTGIGRISTARINRAETVYSYYDENGSALLTPYVDHQLGTGVMAEVIVPYGECTAADKSDNKSDPLYSPLVRGTVDHVVAVVGDDENPIYCMESGVKINAEYLHIDENGYLLPDNTLAVSSCSRTSNGVQFKLDTQWVVPVQVTASPQEYYVGYLERVYNVTAFTAQYLDIRFARTIALSGELDFSDSDIIRKYEWIQSETDGVLRLYFKEEGLFFGYSYSLDRNGRFVFTIKRDIAANSTPVVMLDPGHGGSDPGTLSLGAEYESAVNLDIAEKTADILSSCGVKVLMTRREDLDVSLDDRIAMTRKYSPALFVSIHCDSSETAELYGTHTFYYKSYSQPLAASVQQNMAAVFTQLYQSDAEKMSGCDRGIKFYPFAVTRTEECPSVLVECGYLSNPDDYAFLSSAEGRLKIADAIAKGILEQLNAA